MYIVGLIQGSAIEVRYTTGARMVSSDRHLDCLKLVSLAGFKSDLNPQPGDILGIYIDPNGARYAVARK